MKETLYLTLEQADEWNNYLNNFHPKQPESLEVTFDNGSVITITVANSKILVFGVYDNGGSMPIQGKYAEHCILSGFELTDLYDDYNISVELIK